VSRKWITLAELKLKNEADPAWVARKAMDDRMAEEREAKLNADEAPLVAACGCRLLRQVSVGSG
jgi:hypothetical protein